MNQVGALKPLLPVSGALEALRPVQSCIAHVGFPTSFDQFPGMFATNAEFDGEWPIDIDTLLAQDGQADYWWSAPRWLQGGDVMWMYFTRSGAASIRRLRREFKRDAGAAATAAERPAAYLRDLLDH